ncbi:MAG: DUF4190 domain-containing protein [Bacteroidota bacterium]|nr:DUF4190 domain-containing protein [Bacteroidota bacterium]
MNDNYRTFGTVSLILGLISIVVFCFPVIPFFIAAVGLVFGIISIVNVSTYDDSNGVAIAGTIISSLALLISLVWNIFLFTNIDKEDAFFDFFNNDTTEVFDFPEYQNADTNFIDIDSLMLNDDEIDDLDNSMSDTMNSPGNAPL